jgi:hypothetical protein
MLKEGDYLVAKKTILDNKNEGKKTIFENEKYTIRHIRKLQILNSKRTMNEYYIHGFIIFEDMLYEVFYTKQEERKIKLERLK